MTNLYGDRSETWPPTAPLQALTQMETPVYKSRVTGFPDLTPADVGAATRRRRGAGIDIRDPIQQQSQADVQERFRRQDRKIDMLTTMLLRRIESGGAADETEIAMLRQLQAMSDDPPDVQRRLREEEAARRFEEDRVRSQYEESLRQPDRQGGGVEPSGHQAGGFEPEGHQAGYAPTLDDDFFADAHEDFMGMMGGRGRGRGRGGEDDSAGF